MINRKIINLVTKYCIDNIDFESSGHGWEYYYASLPLCVVDSVFSIGVRYEGVANSIERLCTYYKIQLRAKRKHKIPNIQDQISTTEFLKLFGDKSAIFLADKVYVNRQRTSSNNGILKAEAVIRFLKVLRDFRIEYFQDVQNILNNESFDLCIKNIPGQKSGISLKYFFMLAGSKDLIKPDRMIVRFLQNITGQKFSLDECQTIFSEVTLELNKKGYDLTPQLLDNSIWTYQRMQKKVNTTANNR